MIEPCIWCGKKFNNPSKVGGICPTCARGANGTALEAVLTLDVEGDYNNTEANNFLKAMKLSKDMRINVRLSLTHRRQSLIRPTSTLKELTDTYVEEYLKDNRND